ncbi:hypothetical protein HanIR_Chr17g0896001 [Helianthus annuus]|nr:hypothetical protein HanIR_Chr17g0896001 [Helianthus annuus]
MAIPQTQQALWEDSALKLLDSQLAPQSPADRRSTRRRRNIKSEKEDDRKMLQAYRRW